ncbi:hypothetical protein D3C72_1854710 [compost metagenome]
MRSFSATTNHDGFVFQAAEDTASPNAVALIGPWVAAITRAWAAGTSCAKSRATPCGGRLSQPWLSATMLSVPGALGWSFVIDATDWPASGANAAT